MAQDRSTRLATGSISSLLLAFSAPAIVGMMAQAVYNVVDRVFVGRALGSLGIAGITVAFPYMLVLLGFGMLVGFGAGALISIKLGQRRKEEAEQVLANATVLLLLIAAGLTAFGLIWIDPVLRAFGASQTVLPYAREYLQIIVVATAFQVVGFGLNAVIRSEGNPKTAMLTILIGVLLNTVLAPLFIFGFGWGMRGAGLATALAQAVSALWVLAYFLSGRSHLALRLRFDGPTCARILAIGSPLFAMQIAASVMNSLLNHQLQIHGGDLAISVMGIIYTMALMITMPVFGLNQGAQPIIGYNYGAQRFDRVKQTLQAAVLAATAITVLGFLAAMLFPAQLVRLFDPHDKSLLQLGTHAIHTTLVMLPIVGFQVVGAGYFQAVGKPKQALFLMLSRQVLILIPAVIILPQFLGLDGVWAALPTADLLSALLTATWLFMELRQLDRRHARAGREAVPVLVEK